MPKVTTILISLGRVSTVLLDAVPSATPDGVITMIDGEPFTFIDGEFFTFIP
jgi:hypothetical protein